MYIYNSLMIFQVFWIVMIHSVMVGLQRFGGPCSLHFQDEEDVGSKIWCFNSGENSSQSLL